MNSECKARVKFIINCQLFTSQDKSVQMLIGVGFYEGWAAPDFPDLLRRRRIL